MPRHYEVLSATHRLGTFFRRKSTDCFWVGTGDIKRPEADAWTLAQLQHMQVHHVYASLGLFRIVVHQNAVNTALNKTAHSADSRI